MKVSEAAAIMGIPPQLLRIALQQDKFPEFGIAVDPKKANPPRKHWSYYINRKRFDIYNKGIK